MDEKIKIKEGEEITINIPFTYTIGEIGYYSGRLLETIEDCKNEVLAEITENYFDPANILLTAESPVFL